jgi:hypothetical protein
LRGNYNIVHTLYIKISKLKGSSAVGTDSKGRRLPSTTRNYCFALVKIAVGKTLNRKKDDPSAIENDPAAGRGGLGVGLLKE